MNPETTSKDSESTNNLSANIVETGSVNFAFSEFTNTGGTIGESPDRTAYYATKSVTTNLNSDTVPFVFIWFNLGQVATSYFSMNFVGDYENPYVKWGRAWYTLDNNGGKIRINFYFLDESANLSNGLTLYYRVVSANATESSGL